MVALALAGCLGVGIAGLANARRCIRHGRITLLPFVTASRSRQPLPFWMIVVVESGLSAWMVLAGFFGLLYITAV